MVSGEYAARSANVCFGSFNLGIASLPFPNQTGADAMIIICPNCGTRYEVGHNTIGAEGRKVLCASCQRAWKAKPVAEPEDDMLFKPEQEEALDRAFAAEEAAAREPEHAKAEASKREPIDPALQNKRAREMHARHKLLSKKMPMGRVRRMARLVSLVALMTIILGGVVLREPIVRGLPDLAGVYDALGLGVNVVGLDFANVTSLRSMADGSSALVLSGRIDNVSGHQVEVPPVLVTLINEHGDTLYEWTMTPLVRVLAPGESVEFDTRLTSPPANTDTARLTFVTGGRVGQNA
jgi:predicted Zn finger-like uncharacterized protein